MIAWSMTARRDPRVTRALVLSLCVALVAVGAGYVAVARARATASSLTLAQRILTSGELAGMKPTSPPALTRGATLWVRGLSPRSEAAALNRLRHLGFVAGIDESLSTPGNRDRYGLSLVEQLSSPKSAQAELANAAASNGPWRYFPVSGIPGARGFAGTGSSGGGRNVGFTDGSFYYLVGVGWNGDASNAIPRSTLEAVALALYHRVHGRPAG
jgi:hypothetical protein